MKYKFYTNNPRMSNISDTCSWYSRTY